MHGTNAAVVLGKLKKNAALFLDIDGTLLDVAPSPDLVSVPVELVGTLRQVSIGLSGAVAIITGRPVAEADQLFAPLRLVASGVHGTEIRTSPEGPVSRLADRVPSVVFERLKSVTSVSPKVWVEEKGTGIAIHYRNDPAAAPSVKAELVRLLAGVRDQQLKLCAGRKVFEVVPAGFSKGTALETLAALPQFRDRTPIMIGDDASDESAFAAAERLGGMALRVAGEHFSRDSAQFGGPAEVGAWLDCLARQLAA